MLLSRSSIQPFYTNQKVRKNQTEMAALRWNIQHAASLKKVNRFIKQIEALRKDNEKEMNRLREEIEAMC